MLVGEWLRMVENGGSSVSGGTVQRRYLVVLTLRAVWTLGELGALLQNWFGVATESTCCPIPLLRPRLGEWGAPFRRGVRRPMSTPGRSRRH